MRLFLIACFTLALTLTPSIGVAQTGASSPIVSQAPTEPDAHVCATEGKTTICMCEGVKDCLSLKTSGKCKGDIAVGKDSDRGTCMATTAVQPVREAVGPQRFTNAPRTQTTTRPGSNGTLAASDVGSTEYACSFDLDNTKEYCVCRNVSDCLKLADSGECGSWDIKEKGKGGVCKP